MAINTRIIVFHLVFWSVHAAIFVYGFFKQKNDPELALLNSIGYSVYTSRGAGLILGVDAAALLLPVCRNIVRLIRSSFINRYIPIDENLYFHKWCAYAMLFFTLIHTNAHYTNFFYVETKLPVLGLKAWMVHYLSYAGTTGHIMLVIMLLMYTSASVYVKRYKFEVFWFTHHLFVLFYICLFFHSYGCFVKSSTTGQCKGYNSNYATIPAFCIYIVERILREYRARQPTTLSKVILHPGNTMELRMEKASLQYMPGQYIYLNIPAISALQWHPFTITSSPEEGFVSVHIRIVGDWTRKAADLFGCYQDDDVKRSKSPSPEIRIDGPYGAPAEDLFKYRMAVLIGAGIGVTPAASLLKAIWYKQHRNTNLVLEKVHFIWVSREKESFEWFQSLLASLEESLPPLFLNIRIYLTGKLKTGDIYNIVLNDGMETDPVTELKSHTHYGRPDWDRIFESLRGEFAPEPIVELPITAAPIESDKEKVDVGVFYCGPSPLAKTIGASCKRCSNAKVTFVLRKEHF